MLLSAGYPDCCNVCTVRAGETPKSIAAAYNEPDNGADHAGGMLGTPVLLLYTLFWTDKMHSLKLAPDQYIIDTASDGVP